MTIKVGDFVKYSKDNQNLGIGQVFGIINKYPNRPFLVIFPPCGIEGKVTTQNDIKYRANIYSEKDLIIQLTP